MDALKHVEERQAATSLDGAVGGNALGLLSAMLLKQMRADLFAHTDAIVLDDDLQTVIGLESPNMNRKRLGLALRVLDAVFEQRLQDKRRHHAIAHLKVDIDRDAQTAVAIPGLHKIDIASALFHLVLERGERIGIRKRLTIVVGEVDQQRPGLVGLGSNERHDGADGVKQKMRIDLRLQGAQLHAGRKLVLALKLKARKLRGNEVGKARGKRRLAHIDAAQTGIIQLERAHAMPAHGKRCDNTGAQARKVATRLGRGIAREHALLTAVDHVERSPQYHRGARGAFCRVLAPACQHLLAVGKADGRGDSFGQDDLRGAQGSFGRKAARRVGEYF